MLRLPYCPNNLDTVGFGFVNFGYDERNQSSKYDALKYKWFVFYFQRHIHSCMHVYDP